MAKELSLLKSFCSWVVEACCVKIAVSSLSWFESYIRGSCRFLTEVAGSIKGTIRSSNSVDLPVIMVMASHYDETTLPSPQGPPWSSG